MGKRKSVVLMILLTIVIVVLTAITAFPSFAFPGSSVKGWNPAINQYDLGADLGGGYYVYCYPKGVISETEYKDNVSLLQGKELEEYQASYKAHNGGNLYLDVDIFEDAKTMEAIKEDFNDAKKEIVERFKAKNYSDYRISVVDDYALKVELPASEAATKDGNIAVIGQTVSLFTLTGDFTIQQGGVTVDALKDNKPSEVVKSVSVDTQYGVPYLKIKFTSIGDEMLENFKASQETSDEESSSSSSTDNSTLNFLIGDQTILSFGVDNIDDNGNVNCFIGDIANASAAETDIRIVETRAILLESVINNGGFDIEFNAVSTSDVRTYAPVYGDNTRTLLFIAVGVAMLVLIVFAIIWMGRFGWVNAYVTLSYFIITALCFAFITDGMFELTLGSVLVFLAGMIIVNALHMHTYYAIKKEFDLGKTVESSVKGGYKKTLFGIVDIYAVLLLCGVSLLIGVAGLNTLASQIVICTITGAFCNLLWGRAINYMLLSASKNKYKYFRFVREDDDDEE